MATLAAVEKQIWEREGFKVKLVPLTSKVKALPDYDYTVMAPQRWKISDWKNERLARYVELLRGVTVFRGDGGAVERDLQLGNLRDTYYEAAYGKPPPVRANENVVNIRSREGLPKRSR